MHSLVQTEEKRGDSVLNARKNVNNNNIVGKKDIRNRNLAKRVLWVVAKFLNLCVDFFATPAVASQHIQQEKSSFVSVYVCMFKSCLFLDNLGD